MKNRTCFETTISGMPIKLTQQGRDKFTVVYWKQIRNHLTYSAAATELGAAIMHALACDERLDNRLKGER